MVYELHIYYIYIYKLHIYIICTSIKNNIRYKTYQIFRSGFELLLVKYIIILYHNFTKMTRNFKENTFF